MKFYIIYLKNTLQLSYRVKNSREIAFNISLFIPIREQLKKCKKSRKCQNTLKFAPFFLANNNVTITCFFGKASKCAKMFFLKELQKSKCLNQNAGN